MRNNIGTKQKALWKRHGIAERELILEHLIVDKQSVCIKRNEIKGMNTLIIQIEDLGAINKITLYFEDYRDDRFYYLKELVNKIKMERALDDFEEKESIDLILKSIRKMKTITILPMLLRKKSLLMKLKIL